LKDTGPNNLVIPLLVSYHTDLRRNLRLH
jgi:hypothetical protein